LRQSIEAHSPLSVSAAVAASLGEDESCTSTPLRESTPNLTLGEPELRLHARIEINHKQVSVSDDQSTNGTFVQTAAGEELFVRHDRLQLRGSA
jgi:hypothetical protein